MPDHWIFDGTGMKKGDGIPGLVGWEWHGDPANIPGLGNYFQRPDAIRSRQTQTAAFTPRRLIPGPKGNFVFNASTCWWADGLSEPPGYVRPSVYTTPKGRRRARAKNYGEHFEQIYRVDVFRNCFLAMTAFR